MANAPKLAVRRVPGLRHNAMSGFTGETIGTPTYKEPIPLASRYALS
jgi:hypothetical protein